MFKLYLMIKHIITKYMIIFNFFNKMDDQTSLKRSMGTTKREQWSKFDQSSYLKY
jgi:hypothetical protein